MNPKNLLGFLAACASGFLGGTLASQGRVEATSPSVVRASRYELVNGAGAVVAYWEVDPGNGIRLRFLPRRGSSAIDIGVFADGQPFLRMDGRDEKNRLALELDAADRPLLVMSDQRWEGRVILGFNEPDTPDPTWDNWGLRFHAAGSEKTVAGIGTMKRSDGRVEGFLTVSGKRVR
jgi:hypothetical protein